MKQQSFSIHLAIWNERFLDLAKCSRDEFEQIYQASLKKEITCPYCRNEVYLQISLDKPPSFIHRPTMDPCAEETAKIQKGLENQQTKQINGFQLPQRKQISRGSTETHANWKAPYLYKKLPPFSFKQIVQRPTNDPFYDQLVQLNYRLDEDQWKSVTNTEGPLLLLAGAGSGKTRVITARTYYMLSEKQIPVNRMLLVTFTAKAATEMKERMKIFPYITREQLNKLLIGTFHSIFLRMLTHHEPHKWQKEYLLHSDFTRMQMLKEIGKDFDLDEKDFAYDQALTQIGWWKNHLLLPEHIVSNDLFTERTKHLYEGYEQLKRKHHYYDFDDMLIGCYTLLKEHPKLLEKYQDRFQYIMIDEFQDINKVQYKIVQLLAKKYKNIFVVGDDDQSIYSFRGSDPSYILNFTKDYPNAKTIQLKTNYRSHHAIVSYAHEIIRKNRHRHNKKVTAIRQSEHFPVIFYPYDEEQEATMIINDIKETLESGVSPNEIAILYRTSNNIRALFERFVQEKIPFTLLQDGPSFYERNAVKKVLAFFKLSLNPDDEKAMEEITTALFLKRNTIQDLKMFSISQNITLVEALTKLTNIQDFQKEKIKKIVPLFKTIRKQTPKEAVMIINEKMGLADYLKKNGNEGNVMDRGSDDIKDLLVATQSFATIEEFLNHAEQMVEIYHHMKQSTNYSTQGVQLMTIHRSKGLEFEQVYVVGAVEGNIPHDYALEAMRNGDEAPLEEERRLMYVAVTRAKKVVKISVPTMYRGKRVIISRFLPQ